jgi:chromosomal replication initiator protein
VNVNIPDDVLTFLGENLRSNIRQIEGAIKKLGALSFLSGKTVTMDVAKICISELLGGAEPVNVTVDKIFAAVFNHYGISREEIVSPKRNKEIAAARHVTVHLIRDITDMSLPNIGKIFDRDHATIMASLKAVEKRLKTEPELQTELAEIKKEVTG